MTVTRSTTIVNPRPLFLYILYEVPYTHVKCKLMLTKCTQSNNSFFFYGCSVKFSFLYVSSYIFFYNFLKRILDYFFIIIPAPTASFLFFYSEKSQTRHQPSSNDNNSFSLSLRLLNCIPAPQRPGAFFSLARAGTRQFSVCHANLSFAAWKLRDFHT